MKKSELDAQKRISQLREIITEHNRRYYIDNLPIISDFEYDILLNELQTLEIKYPQFFSNNSPTNIVGSDIEPKSSQSEFIQVAHKYPMLSISNTYDKGELSSFNERVMKAIGQPVKYVCELKIDGTAISLTYCKGRLERAITRGDGTNGDDVTRNVSRIDSIPKFLKGDGFPSEFEIRGEIFMPWDSFDEINKRRIDNEDVPFANPRNAAAGSLKLLDSEEIANRGLQSILYHLIPETPICSSHHESLDLAKSWGLPVSPYSRRCDSIEEVISYLDYWENERKSLPYPTDGVVIKVDDLNYQKTLGFTAKTPRWATAYKFKPEQALSKLLSVDFQVGRTGAITPVANLEPVLLSGTTVKRASLHNNDQINLLEIHINDYVYVEKGGEIIPKIVSVEKSKRGTDLQEIIFPKYCPDCNTALVKVEDEAKHYCPNQNGCPTQIKARFLHFSSRKAMDILLGEATINQLFNLSYIRKLPDLYRLSKDQLLTLDGWKEKSADRFLASLSNSKRCPFSRVLFALGIRYVGETTAKKLVNHFRSIENIISASRDELLNVEEVGEILADSLLLYFSDLENIEMIKELKGLGLEFELKETDGNILSNSLMGINIVISGNFSIPRDDLKKKIESHSGRVVSSVSSNTSFLVAGEKPGPAKIQTATKLGVKIINEDELNEMI